MFQCSNERSWAHYNRFRNVNWEQTGGTASLSTPAASIGKTGAGDFGLAQKVKHDAALLRSAQNKRTRTHTPNTACFYWAIAHAFSRLRTHSLTHDTTRHRERADEWTPSAVNSALTQLIG